MEEKTGSGRLRPSNKDSQRIVTPASTVHSWRDDLNAIWPAESELLIGFPQHNHIGSAVRAHHSERLTVR